MFLKNKTRQWFFSNARQIIVYYLYNNSLQLKPLEIAN